MKNLIEANQMSDLKTTLFSGLAATGTATTVDQGLLAFTTQNATALTVLIALAGFIVTLVFGYLVFKEHKRKGDIMEAQLSLNQEEAEREKSKADNIIITPSQLDK